MTSPHLELLGLTDNEIWHVSIENGDTCVYLNGTVILSVEAWENTTANTKDIANAMGVALNIPVHELEMAVPLDDDWNWDDVYELLPDPAELARAAPPDHPQS